MRHPLLRALCLLFVASAAVSCAERCESACDCAQDGPAPLKCPGEFACVEGSCDYVCRTPCTELPFTCGEDEACNGAVCSARTACP